MVSLALFQPEIPANTGTLMRLSACLNVPLHIIGPTTFQMDDRSLKRAGMDYRDKARTENHVDFEHFCKTSAWAPPRLVLMTTKAEKSYLDFSFQPTDVIILGRESSGAPEWLHGRADARLNIPMMPDARSLNMAVAASMVLGEALRQTRAFPDTAYASSAV